MNSIQNQGLENIQPLTFKFIFENNMLIARQRFTFWRVFWVVLAFYLFFLLLGILAALSASQKGMDWSAFLRRDHLISQCANMVSSAVFFFFTLNYYHRFFVERKGFFHFLRLSVIASVLMGAFFFGKLKLLEATSMEKEAPGLIIFSIVIYTLMQAVLSIFIAYLVYLRDEKKRQKVLEEQKMQLEVEKSSANLNFLKAQINPHFLHNTLNFLYAKSLPYSPELSEGILTLSDIMRYALSEGNAKDGKAPLKDEIEHVWNVIKINQLRFSNKLNVNFNVNGLVEGISIIPFVLITIVENAFKHGDLKDQSNPIEIELDVDRKRLRFWCVNKKKSGPKELSTGVGLDNIRKRLDLAYGNNYSFNVKNEADFYSTELIIDPV
jgi:two-component system, LytTR family, sensor kinase